MSISVHVLADHLTDGSTGYGVVIRQPGQDDMRIACFNEPAAERLQQSLVDVINLHAADPVTTGEPLRAEAGWAA